MAESVLAELAAGNYRETAVKLREVAAITHSPDNRAELLMMADSFDRLAARDQRRPASPEPTARQTAAARVLEPVA